MTDAPASELVEAAQVLSRLGLVTAYGHVSVRRGDRVLITPAADLALVDEADLIDLALDAATLPPRAPAEAWAHLALYRARADARAIARAQPPSTFGAAATMSTLSPMHGQAAWLGERIPLHDSALLLRSPELAERAAAALPSGEALLLRGNGGITIGATPGVAVARMWLLAAACDVWLAANAGGLQAPPGESNQPSSRGLTVLSPAEITSWRLVADELLPRLWQHLRRKAKVAS